MKISIITPVYNEGNYFDRYLESIKTINYPKSDFEIVIVDDASTDDSSEKIKDFIKKNPEIDIRFFENEKNSGVLYTRNKAANLARYDYLLNIDGHSIIHSDTISNFVQLHKETNDDVIMGACLFQDDNINAIFSNIVLRRLYGKEMTSKNHKDLYLNNNNFEKSLKGTNPLFIKKSLYLQATPEKSGKAVNDDVRLLKKIIEIKGKFLRTSQASIIYLARDSVIDELDHIHKRGPRFVDYYLRPGTKFYRYIQLLVLFSLLAPFALIGLILLFGIKTILIIALLGIIASFAGSIILFARNIKEILVSLLFPIFLLVFILGVYKGLYIRFLKWIKPKKL